MSKGVRTVFGIALLIILVGQSMGAVNPEEVRRLYWEVVLGGIEKRAALIGMGKEIIPVLIDEWERFRKEDLPTHELGEGGRLGRPYRVGETPDMSWGTRPEWGGRPRYKMLDAIEGFISGLCEHLEGAMQEDPPTPDRHVPDYYRKWWQRNRHRALREPDWLTRYRLQKIGREFIEGAAATASEAARKLDALTDDERLTLYVWVKSASGGTTHFEDGWDRVGQQLARCLEALYGKSVLGARKFQELLNDTDVKTRREGDRMLKEWGSQFDGAFRGTPPRRWQDLDREAILRGVVGSGFQSLKTLPAGATALLEPPTGAPR